MVSKFVSKYDLSFLLDGHGVVHDAIINDHQLIANSCESPIGKNIRTILPLRQGEIVFGRLESQAGDRFSRSLSFNEIVLGESEFFVGIEILGFTSPSSDAREILVFINRADPELVPNTPADPAAKNRLLLGVARAAKELFGSADVYTCIQSALVHLGEGLHADRAYLFTIHVSDFEYFCSHRCEWNSGDYSEQIDNTDLYNVPLTMIGDFCKTLLQGKVFRAIVANLPAGPVKENLESQSIKSILICPVIINDRFWGYAGFDDCTYGRKWTGTEIGVLSSFTSLIQQRVSNVYFENREEDLLSAAPLVSDVLKSL
jgi:hypothetical protein